MCQTNKEMCSHIANLTGKWLTITFIPAESEFADDLALYAVSCTAFESVGRSFVRVADQYDLIVSLSKTNGLAVGCDSWRCCFCSGGRGR